jgi:hypothetical protein
VSPHEDYIAGEQSDPVRVQIQQSTGGILDGVQLQVLSYLGRMWGMGEPRFKAEEAIQFSQTFRKSGAAITWDVPVQKNGLIPESFVEQLAAIGKSHRRTRGGKTRQGQ